MFTSRKRFSQVSLTIILAIAPFLGGCAMNARPKNMTPSSFEVVNKHSKAVCIQIIGDVRGSFDWPTGVLNADFQSALTEAIMKSEVFSKVSADSNADYVLTVDIAAASHQKAGVKLGDTMTARWELRSTRPNAVVWKDIITTDFTATGGDAFVAMKRFRLAREGAARENIRTGIQEISDVKLE